MSGALILGGTSGIGRSLAIESLKRGFRTVIIGRHDPDEKDGGLSNSEFVRADLSETEGFQRSFQSNWTELNYVFWVAGAYLRANLVHTKIDDIRRLANIHFIGFANTLSVIHRAMIAASLSDGNKRSCHLTVIGSTSSWRKCDGETVYGALKAAQAQLARNYSRELTSDLPGSKVTLVNLSGIKKADDCRRRGLDPDYSMTAENLSGLIWDIIEKQAASFAELNILRGEDWSPIITGG